MLPIEDVLADLPDLSDVSSRKLPVERKQACTSGFSTAAFSPADLSAESQWTPWCARLQDAAVGLIILFSEARCQLPVSHQTRLLC